MAAVSVVPPPVRPRRRRPPVLVAVWIVALAGLAFWSVHHSAPTVPDQRTIAQALPVLQRAAGVMAAAADGPDRVIVLGPLRLTPGCRITPVRHGVEGTRAVTVFVQADGARKALDGIAAALPHAYRAEVRQSNAGRLLGLEADAGGYVAVDARTPAAAQSFTLEASTGCRPAAGTAGVAPDPVPAAPPAALSAALRVLATTTDPVVPQTVALACPSGPAGTYAVDNLTAHGDLGQALQPVLGGATVIRSDPGTWAYRAGGDSLVVGEDGGRITVTATTACR